MRLTATHRFSNPSLNIIQYTKACGARAVRAHRPHLTTSQCDFTHRSDTARRASVLCRRRVCAYARAPANYTKSQIAAAVCCCSVARINYNLESLYSDIGGGGHAQSRRTAGVRRVRSIDGASRKTVESVGCVMSVHQSPRTHCAGARVQSEQRACVSELASHPAACSVAGVCAKCFDPITASVRTGRFQHSAIMCVYAYVHALGSHMCGYAAIELHDNQWSSPAADDRVAVFCCCWCCLFVFVSSAHHESLIKSNHGQMRDLSLSRNAPACARTTIQMSQLF